MDNEEVKKVELVEELTNSTFSPEKNRFIPNNSAAAASRGTLTVEKSRDLHKSNEVSNLIIESQQKIARENERQRKWFDSGIRAKQRGYGDFSPFYENKTADYFFKCGYNNVSFENAQVCLKEEIQQIFEQDSTLSESVNEIAVDNNESKATDFLP